MATQTPNVTLPVQAPEPVGAPVNQPTVNQAPPPPDPRDVAASSKLPYIPGAVSSSSSKLSSITAALGYNRFTPRTFGPSGYIPSFVLMSIVLSSIDRLMVNTYRFHQSNPDWHPVISQIYYGIIFVVHILRVRRSAQVITEDESTFLEWFEGNWPFQSLPIAGPLKHFLQSITVTSGPTKYYGNIVPTTPSTYGSVTAQLYAQRGNGFLSSWPQIPVLMDIINDMLNAGTRANFNPNDQTHWQQYFLPMTHLFGVPIVDERVFSGAGMTDLVFLPATSMPTWYNSARNLMFPPRLNGVATPATTTIAEYLRLGTTGTQHTTWLPSVIGMMQRHAQFLKDSTSLASISCVGVGACLPIVTLAANNNLSLVNAAANQVVTPVAAIPAAPAAGNVPATPGRAAGYRATRFPNLNISALSKSEDLHLIAEQFALLSSVNVSYTGLAARGNRYYTFPTDAQTRTGPYWTLPDVKSHPEIDVYGQIVTFLTGAFHNDQRMNK